MRVSIDKVKNGFTVCSPMKDDAGDLVSYETDDFVYLTLEEVIEKVKEVYGS